MDEGRLSRKMNAGLIRTDSFNSDFQELVNLLNAELKAYDGAEHEFYMQYNQIENIKHVIVAYADNKPVGCGSIKEYSPETAEVKRMYVNKDARGKGIGKTILAGLENWARELGCKCIVLETGKRQKPAVALYSNCGYEIIPNYGQYIGVVNSICFRKML